MCSPVNSCAIQGCQESALNSALRWQFYLQQPCTLRDVLQAERLIDWFHARDTEELQSLAIAAAVKAAPLAVPWATEVLHGVSKAIGVSPAEAWNLIEDLEARGVVRIETAPAAVERPGMRPLPRLCWWVVCE
jgi:hypothetical protein